MPAGLNTDIALGTRLLLRLYRGGEEYRIGTETDWRALLAACDYHQVAPIVLRRIQHFGLLIPETALESLRARLYRISAYNHFLAEKMAHWVAQLRREGIDTLALKGPAVAIMVYGDLSLRQYEDIDLLVRNEHVSRAVHTLFDCGFEPARGHAHRYKHPGQFHEITLQAPGKSYAVDLHWRLAPPYARRFGPEVAEVWRRACRLQLPQGSISVLSREDLFLALCQHGARHRWWQLKWLFDVGELWRSSGQLDWPSLAQSLKTRPLVRAAVILVALLVQDLLGIEAPAEAREVLEPTQRVRAVAQEISAEFRLRGQTNGSAHDTLLGLEQRPLVRAKYMLGEALQYPVREVLFTITAKDFQFLRLPEKFRLLYYVVRPLRLLLQHGRIAARRIWSMAR